MTSGDAQRSYSGNALNSAAGVTLPETMVNRAQSLTRSIIMRWLRGIINAGDEGYCVISGGGRTIIVLYREKLPIAAAVIRGPNAENMVEALNSLRTDGPSNFFAMTYDLPRGVALSLAGLFGSPDSEFTLDNPREQLREVLADQQQAALTGAILLRFEDVLWAAMLLVEGEIIGCYGSDDTKLKGTLDDAKPLLRLDELEVAVYPTFVDERLEDVISFDSTSYLGSSPAASIENTEVAMIELLSEFENGLTRIEAGDGPEALVRLLTTTYQNARSLAQGGPALISSGPPAHPLLDSHWLPEERAIDTEGLLRTLEMAAIPEAWLAASDALILALESTVEQQLTWLSMEDQLAATSLKEAFAELLSESRNRVREWRQTRRRTESETIRPLSRPNTNMTIP